MVEMGAGVTSDMARKWLLCAQEVKLVGERPVFVGRCRGGLAYILTNMRLIVVNVRHHVPMRAVGPLSSLKITHTHRSGSPRSSSTLAFSRGSSLIIALERLAEKDADRVARLFVAQVEGTTDLKSSHTRQTHPALRAGTNQLAGRGVVAPDRTSREAVPIRESRQQAISGKPARKEAWTTYYPWALALYGSVSVILLIIIVASWIPSPEIPGVPASKQSFPVFPGLLGILCFVMTGRQLYLRTLSRR